MKKEEKGEEGRNMQLFIKNQYKVIHNEFTYLPELVLLITSIRMLTSVAPMFSVHVFTSTE